ncbi:MAG: hypothetical protein LBT16_07155 [Treponema sp.]|jgi:hypothetical protein|nr:hypothetical protein [Treponema sp.]
MAKRTQIVCIHEGKKGPSIDPVFASAFLKAYDPEWLRPWKTGALRLNGHGGKSALREAFPQELRLCNGAGADTTLIVLAGIDDLVDGEQLKKKYWETAQKAGVSRELFEKAVFIFPKDRIENWVQFLLEGATDESREGPRVKDNAK